MAGVELSVSDGVGHIRLTRPEVSNSVDLATAHELQAAVDAAASDDIRVVLLTGDGPRFCAGGDVASMAAAGDTPESASDYLQRLADALDGALQSLTGLPKPVVAGVQGAAAGAGLAVLLSADVVVAGRSTKFLTAYAGIGLTPDCGLSWLLPRAIGQQRALELFLTGRVLAAEEALAWGLVTEVVDDAEVADRAAELAARIAAGPAYALGQAKRLARAAWMTTRAEAGTEESRTIMRAVTTDEAQELIAAFTGRGR